MATSGTCFLRLPGALPPPQSQRPAFPRQPCPHPSLPATAGGAGARAGLPQQRQKQKQGPEPAPRGSSLLPGWGLPAPGRKQPLPSARKRRVGTGPAGPSRHGRGCPPKEPRAPPCCRRRGRPRSWGRSQAGAPPTADPAQPGRARSGKWPQGPKAPSPELPGPGHRALAGTSPRVLLAAPAAGPSQPSGVNQANRFPVDPAPHVRPTHESISVGPPAACPVPSSPGTAPASARGPALAKGRRWDPRPSSRSSPAALVWLLPPRVAAVPSTQGVAGAGPKGPFVRGQQAQGLAVSPGICGSLASSHTAESEAPALLPPGARTAGRQESAAPAGRG